MGLLQNILRFKLYRFKKGAFIKVLSNTLYHTPANICGRRDCNASDGVRNEVQIYRSRFHSTGNQGTIIFKNGFFFVFGSC